MPKNRPLTTSGLDTFSSADLSTSIFCDICSRPVDSSRVRKKDNLYLCHDCFFSIDSVGNNMMRSSITRFFSGNVL
ncbi:MAG: hypothetical protein HQK62_09805 [Desulfamplus sp.]|nr:hypothetical protein [Desulfamplus sp.]